MKALLLVLISFTAIAQDCFDGSDESLKLAKALSLPNCANESNLGDFKNKNLESLCVTCKNNFETILGQKVPKPEKEQLQKDFLKSALQEYKKNMVSNLMTAVKLRGLPSTGASFTKSLDACKMKDQKQILNDCKSETAKKLLASENFGNISQSISQELAQILSNKNDYKAENPLLTRSRNSCFIPEKDILLFSTSAIEEELSPTLIEYLQKVDYSKITSIDEIFDSEAFASVYSSDISGLKESLKTHPLFASLMSDKQKFQGFFKSVSSPADLKKLKSALYDSKSGKNFDDSLAANCSNSYDTLINSMCSDKFDAGLIDTVPDANFDKLSVSSIEISDAETANDEKILQNNMRILSLCEIPKSKDNLNLLATNKSITKGMSQQYQDLTFKDFSSEKFDFEIGRLNQYLCSNSSCADQTLNCKVLKKYLNSKDPKSLEAKLANSSNKEVNELLRSMIGDTSKIDSKTKDILIAQGIIPKDDGSMVKQPDIPERQPDFVAKEAQQQNGGATVSAKAGAPTNVANLAKSGRNPSSESPSFNDEGYSNSNTKSTSNTLPDFSDLMDDQQEMRGIQDEIKRRLLGLPQNKPANINDAKKIARESFKSRGKKISPEQEDSFASRMMQQADPTIQNSAANNAQTPNVNPENRAQVSGGESAQAKWRKGQDQAALMGMKGAQDVLNKDGGNAQATDAKPKDMTKVALNLAEDPRVTLSDMFNKKIDQNDPETQLLKVLLRNKNNFLLQVKAMNFKIIFDDKNNFNLLLESGDQQEAARIRPQLEMFLKKLKT